MTRQHVNNTMKKKNNIHIHAENMVVKWHINAVSLLISYVDE